jgi:hydrogenase maturation protease
VIGVGSELRTDDAVGRRVADAVAARALPGVEVVSVHQLTPEVAAELAGRALVVFVDASVDVDEVTVRTLPPVVGDAAEAMTHHLDPAGLLALAARLGWSPAAARVVHVPAADLGFGTEASPAAARAIEVATDRILALCRTASP